MNKVSVIIPTYNRFKYLLNTIKSVKEQTYTNIEIIVVNDCSREKEYYEYNWEDNDIIIIHLPENSAAKFGYPSVGYVINQGLEIFTGDYFATCDDDDIWFPQKLELQIKAMLETGCQLSCTDGLIGNGAYDITQKYKTYLGEHYYETLKHIYKNKGSNLLDNGFPRIWNYDFLNIHNCIIASSVIIHKNIISKMGKQLEIKMGGTLINGEMVHIDYEYWLRALEHTNCVYVDDIGVYYDSGHGYGQDYH